jgi:osmoprotectant transport system substrate-binding protein
VHEDITTNGKETFVRFARLHMFALLLVLALVAAACGGSDFGDSGDSADSDGGSGSTEGGTEAAEATAGGESLEGADITVGSKDFDEQLVLGNISKLALESAGANVTDQINLGGTDAARSALTSGEISHYWEYTGTGWINHLGNTDPIPDRQEQWEAVKEADLANGVVWTQPAPFNNTYGIAFPSEAAGDLDNPETITDFAELAQNSPDLATLCVESEFASRDDGLPGMEEAYDFEVPEDNVTVLDTGVVYSAMDARDPCNFGEVFTTDGRIAALDLTVLEDDQGFFPLYNATPNWTTETYETYGEALEACFDPIAEALTQEAMTELNKRVSSDGERPEAVAQDFLESNDLLANCGG